MAAKRRPSFVDGFADGIKEGGAAARDVGFHFERDDFGDGDGDIARFGGVVEEDESEAGLAGCGLLVAQEGVEAFDGVGADGLHGAGTVEDECDFGFDVFRVFMCSGVWVDRWWLLALGGDVEKGVFPRGGARQDRACLPSRGDLVRVGRYAGTWGEGFSGGAVGRWRLCAPRPVFLWVGDGLMF